MASRAASRTLTDHEEIRQWAEERGAAPACIRGTGRAEDTGMIRLDFPGFSGEQSLEPIAWDDWFRKFDESKLALLVQDETAGGERSNFNKLIARTRAQDRGDKRDERSHRGTSRTSSRPSSARRSMTANAARKKSSRSGTSSSGTRSTSSRSARTTASSSRTKRAGNSRSAKRQSSSTRKTGRTSATASRPANSKSRSGKSASSGTRAKAPARSRTSQNTRTTSRSREAGRSARSSSRSRTAAKSATNRFLTDHEEIRSWAEEREGSPACVRGTGSNDDVGMIRLDFPGYTGKQSLEHINWDDWFEKFDERGLALLVQGETARGQKSNFNKLVSRETAGESGRGRSAERKSPGKSRTSSSRRRAA